MIQLDGVSKTYQGPNGPVEALRGMSLGVAPGEFVAVRGPSGCGKSTLLLIVGGLTRPSAGRVVVAGEDLTSTSQSALTAFRSRKVGFVFQMFHLLPYLSVLENVTAAALPEERASAVSRARELLAQFGLEHRLHHRPAELSAGERQRTAVARAVLNRPPLVLADEPTGNLDPASAEGVLDLLRAYRAEGGTVLLVTHSEQAAAYADRTVVINGKL